MLIIKKKFDFTYDVFLGLPDFLTELETGVLSTGSLIPSLISMANLLRQSLLPNQETKIRREIVKIQFYWLKANNTGAFEAYLPVDLDCLNKADGVVVVVELVETLPGQVGASFEGFAGQFVYVL